MGIYDRDYFRNSARGGFGSFRMWTVTTWLIVINVAVYVLDGLLPYSRAWGFRGPIEQFGYFSAATAVFHGEVWRFITYQFLHQNFEHILFNMIALYFFGPMVESMLGARRYLGFYLSCGVAGAVMYLILWATQIVRTRAGDPMIGASAAIFGVLIAAARIAPATRVLLWFIVPMRLNILIYLLLAFVAYSLLSHGYNAGGQAAHLGGALWGFVLIRNSRWLNFLDRLRLKSGRPRGGGRKDWRGDWDR